MTPTSSKPQLPSLLRHETSLSVTDYLLEQLEAEGVECVFGIPGGPATPIYDGLRDRTGIRTISTRHEGGAAFMAAGYARLTGRLGVTILTTGPGATNALTGIAAAKTDSLPVLVVTAQVATATFGKGSLQDSTIDRVGVVEMFRPATKYSAMLANPVNFPDFLRQAIRIALSGRPGPVHISIPTDMMKRPAPGPVQKPESYRPVSRPFDREAVKRTAVALLESHCPAILAGHGVNLAGAREELLELAERLEIPVATTPKGKGAFPEDHPLSLRVFGQASSPKAESYLLSDDVDTLFVVGSGLHEISTQGWETNLMPRTAFIQLDVEPTAIGRNYPVTHALVGDAKATLRELLFEIRRLQSRGEDVFRPERKPPAGPAFLTPREMRSNASPMKPQRFMAELNRVLPSDAVVFLDVGNHALWAVHYLDAVRERTFVHNWGEFAAMGTGLAGAIGGKLAAPQRPVVAIVGDGGFGMVGMEVLTAVTYAIPVVWIVFNDGRFNTVHHGQRLQYSGRTHASEFHRMDVAGVADSLGALGLKISKPAQVGPVLERALNANRPAVVDVCVDADEIPPILSRIRSLDKFFAGLEAS